MKAEAGNVVIMHYTLTVDGEEMDSSAGRDPMPYLHGSGNIVPGLERELEGKEAGATVSVTVAPADGYGEISGPGPQRVYSRQLPEQIRDWGVGRAFMAQGSDGEDIVLYITKREGDQVWLDTNHPLAGKTLDFSVEIVSIRESSEVEREHGHAHGLDGNAQHH